MEIPLQQVSDFMVWLALRRHTTIKNNRKFVYLFFQILLLRVIYNLHSAPAKRLGLRSISCHTSPTEARVCGGKRERKSVGNVVSQQLPLEILPCPPRNAAYKHSRTSLAVCVTSEKERS